MPWTLIQVKCLRRIMFQTEFVCPSPGGAAGGAGLVGPAAPVLARSGNAVFQDGRLISVTSGGDPAVCIDVFVPCQGQHSP